MDLEGRFDSIGEISVPHWYSIVVGTPFILFAMFAGRSSDASADRIFPIGDYKLDEPVVGLSGLKEFTPTEYSVMGRRFEGETDYDAPSVMFLGRSWQLQLGTVHGKIYKIAPYLKLREKQDASTVAMECLRYCTVKLGKPAEQRTGFFVWDARDGNAILQTAELADGFGVSIFLTSSSVKNFKRK